MGPPRRIATAIAVSALAAGLVEAAAPLPALASPAQVVRSGACTNHSIWKASLNGESSATIEAGLEVDHSRIGDVWKVVLTHDSSTYFTGYRIAKAPDGTFEVARPIANRHGVDVVTGTARNTRTGEVCRGSAKI